MSDTADFFRSRLDQMIDLRHPLAVLASRMPWQEIEASVAQLFARRVRSGKTMVDVDLFGSTASLVGAGVTKAGRPRLPLRLMISLLYLKHAFNGKCSTGTSHVVKNGRSGFLVDSFLATDANRSA